MTRSIQVFILIIAILSGCSDNLEYSPNQAHDGDSPMDLNYYNLAKLKGSAPDDTLTIVFAGDSQQFYDEVDLFVEKVNKIRDADLIFIAGDISDFGLLQEFEWIAERLQALEKPYFGVIGNHDVVSNGEMVFKKMFGPLDFSFVYDSVKFILHNTNSREYLAANVPDIVWLREQLVPEAGVKSVVAVSHVPPFSGDFNRALEEPYTALFRSTPGFLLSLHGHIHRHTDGFPYDDGVRYITSFSFEQKNLLVLRIASGVVLKEVVSY